MQTGQVLSLEGCAEGQPAHSQTGRSSSQRQFGLRKAETTAERRHDIEAVEDFEGVHADDCQRFAVLPPEQGSALVDHIDSVDIRSKFGLISRSGRMFFEHNSSLVIQNVERALGCHSQEVV